MPDDILQTEKWLLEQVKGSTAALLELARQWEDHGGFDLMHNTYVYFSLCQALCGNRDMERAEQELGEMRILMTSAEIQDLRSVILEKTNVLFKTEIIQSDRPDLAGGKSYLKDFGKYYALLIRIRSICIYRILRLRKKMWQPSVDYLRTNLVSEELVTVSDGTRRTITEGLNSLKSEFASLG